MIISVFRCLLPVAVAFSIASCGVGANLHQVDANVWRSSQPEKRDFRAMEKDGIREVLNLRRYHSDDAIAGNLVCHHVRMRAGKISDKEMLEALRVLAAAKQPIVVHCWHGSDRTGAVIAMYRMVIQRWPREKAIAEVLDPRYGHHADVFPNVREYLETVDVEKMRRLLREEGLLSGTA
ncbi:tyrosine-protein phosphatase [Luteolibacter sp. SL250]|uniref:phosphatase domain-containing putative toxin n=1 Tax=Luteolibacter sp. SL250 TaxID=2995170 RepID=UPI00226FFAA3|nr:tyrosine-protein phosphatase [Luteolibacter sp. SL250]WAC20653.1 tyrosine-protein phosphatase [Luteolibacter sp. SL250]